MKTLFAATVCILFFSGLSIGALPWQQRPAPSDNADRDAAIKAKAEAAKAAREKEKTDAANARTIAEHLNAITNKYAAIQAILDKPAATNISSQAFQISGEVVQVLTNGIVVNGRCMPAADALLLKQITTELDDAGQHAKAVIDLAKASTDNSLIKLSAKVDEARADLVRWAWSAGPRWKNGLVMVEGAAKDLVDGDKWNGTADCTGTYQHTSAAGAVKTIRAFAIRP